MVLMFAAAGLMFQNSKPYRLHCFVSEHPELPPVRGWPFPAIWGNGDIWLREESKLIPFTLRQGYPALGISLDIAFFLAVLGGMAFVCEWWIRRSKA